MPKAVYRSGCCHKHKAVVASILGPNTPQSSVLPLDHCDLGGLAPENFLKFDIQSLVLLMIGCILGGVGLITQNFVSVVHTPRVARSGGSGGGELNSPVPLWPRP